MMPDEIMVKLFEQIHSMFEDITVELEGKPTHEELEKLEFLITDLEQSFEDG